ncbi:hypothetical protein B0H10DRAFT_722820 [Mycena sp. CBHHK59/15]|nr:hypothetical protein B0H10DRAFT_722820 [Mycena sp. CBHHK59/15]
MCEQRSREESTKVLLHPDLSISSYSICGLAALIVINGTRLRGLGSCPGVLPCKPMPAMHVIVVPIVAVAPRAPALDSPRVASRRIRYLPLARLPVLRPSKRGDEVTTLGNSLPSTRQSSGPRSRIPDLGGGTHHHASLSCPHRILLARLSCRQAKSNAFSSCVPGLVQPLLTGTEASSHKTLSSSVYVHWPRSPASRQPN